MAAEVNTAHLLTPPRQNYNYTTEQPLFRTAKNQAEWKSYNYGIKEETTKRLVGRGGNT